jgi:hypothetical protein
MGSVSGGVVRGLHSEPVMRRERTRARACLIFYAFGRTEIVLEDRPHSIQR